MLHLIEMATVTAQAPDQFAVFVSLDRLGGQGPTLPVQVLTPGPRDGTVFKGKAGLPTVGTRGLVAFARGDSRNGHWMGATAAALVDASSFAPGQGGLCYDAHYGGGYSWLGEDGTVQEALPDGSTLRLGPTVPEPTRHVLTGTQGQRRSPFTEAQRVKTAPAPFPLDVTLASGVRVTANGAGALSIAANAGQSLTLVCGGCTAVLDGEAQTITIETGASSVTINGASNEVTLTNGTVTALINGAVMLVTRGGGTPKPVKLSDESNSNVLSAT